MYGATKTLYFDLSQYNDEADLQNFYKIFNYKKVDKPTEQQLNDEHQLKIYFEGEIL